MISDNVFTGISSNSPEEAPQALVKWTRVPPILNQAVSDGVTCALVMRTNGSLLSVAGDDAKIEKIIGGIVSSIWNSFQEEINACLASEQKMMLTTCKVRHHIFSKHFCNLLSD